MMPASPDKSAREKSALQMYQRNRAWAVPNSNYQTQLTDTEEEGFLQWLKKNKIPFDVSDKFPDYDMRGYYKEFMAGGTGATYDPSRMHFTDKYKTPYHESFSRESQYAVPDKAPFWQDVTGGGNRLVTPQGKVLYQEDAKGNPLPGYGSR